MNNQRVEYIDAMRGFTMLLVIYAHVRFFGYHINDIEVISSFNSFFLLIRMPLFFFVSGFLFYKEKWDRIKLQKFIIKKAQIQILPSLLFMLIYASIFNYNFIDGLFDYYKLGYWFTFTLFSFFIAYFIFNYFLLKIKIKEPYKDILWIVLALFIHFATTDKFMQIIGLYGSISKLFGIILFKYFIFFILGALTKKHYNKFQHYKNHKSLSTIIILAFFFPLILFFKYNLIHINVWTEHLAFLYFGILGMYIVFLYFNKYQETFEKKNIIGKLLQYIGKRTLDIYLLHYLFVPRDIEWLATHFYNFKNPCIELFISLGISIIVICMCLLLSNIIRISPFLERNLFGQNNK